MEEWDSRETGFLAFLESVKDSPAHLRGNSGLVAVSDQMLVFPWVDKNKSSSMQVGTAATMTPQPWAEKAQNFPGLPFSLWELGKEPTELSLNIRLVG